MTQDKENNRINARKILNAKGIKFDSFNNDLHWKIGTVNFYPTTLKWRDDITVDDCVNKKNIKHNYGTGLKELIEYLRQATVSQAVESGAEPLIKLSVEQIFDIAKKSKDKSLMGICTSIHERIYNG